MADIVSFCKKFYQFILVFFQANFSSSKHVFFFLWLIVSTKGVPMLCVCSFLVRQFSRMEFSSFLVFLFVVSVFLYEESQEAEDLAPAIVLFSLSVWRKLLTLRLSVCLRAVKQFLFYNFFNIKSFIKSSFFFFNKNSKKEFNSEKLNTFLLKKKKQEGFLKKYYRY